MYRQRNDDPAQILLHLDLEFRAVGHVRRLCSSLTAEDRQSCSGRRSVSGLTKNELRDLGGGRRPSSN